MAGFDNDCIYGTNIDLSGAGAGRGGNPTLLTDGQMLIATTALNAGGTHVNVGTLTSPSGTLTIGYSSPNITLDLAGGGLGIDSITPNSGTTPVVPDGAGNVSIVGSGSITTVGSLNTLTTQLTGLTNHALLVGAGTATITKVGPSAISGQVLQSAGASADPAFSTATYPATATSTGTILRADGTNWVATTSTYPSTNAVSTLLYASSANVMSALATANRGVLTTSATGVPAITALATNGQIIIGSTAGAPAAALISAGTGITVTNGSNSISIAVSATGVVQTLTGDSGGARSPTAGNMGIVGQDGITVAGASSTLTVTPRGVGTNNMFLGNGVGNLTLSGTRNFGYGGSSLQALTSGSENFAGGVGALLSLQSGSDNVAIGDSSLLNNVSGSNNIAIGQNTLAACTAGDNIAIGNLAGSSIVSNSQLCAVGHESMRFATGAENCAFGAFSGNLISTGTGNTCLGTYTQSGFTSTGSYNTSVGWKANQVITSGSYNCSVGWQSGQSYTSSESSNICIMASGTASESNTLRIGTAGTGNGLVNRAFIAGINGVTVTGTAVLCSTAGQLGTVPSSIKFKENIQDMGDKSDFINRLRPVTFSYKEHSDLSFGLIAEEVEVIDKSLVVYDEAGDPYSVKYHEMPAMLLNELQKLRARVEYLEKKVR